MKRGDVVERTDVNFSASTIHYNRRYSKPSYPLMPLGKLVTVVQYGTSARATEEVLGFPILRMNNLQNDGWDLSDLKYIDLSITEADTYRLEKGDILFNRTNSKELVGKCEVFREEGHWLFASYLIRVRLDTEQADPEFIATFLNTAAGRIQIDRLSRQIIGMSNVNAQEVRELTIPLPPPKIQHDLMNQMKAAQDSRQSKLNEASALLTSLDAYLLDWLGVAVPPSDNRSIYAILHSALQGSKQIGADYFHPERTGALRAIQTAKKVKHAARLGEIVDFVREYTNNYKPEQYLGLANVQSQTGEVSESSEALGQGQAAVFKTNDILFARLRPYLNKVWCAEHDGVCSTEFHVMRIKETVSDLLPSYLAAVLRSSVTVAQTKHMMTGNTLPRLANEDIVDLFIPIPEDTRQQQMIVDELYRRRIASRRLREEAESEWAAAKEWFESRLLGPEAVR